MSGTEEKNVLITGSSGSLGAALCREFLEEGYWVTGIDLEEPKTPPAAKSGLERWDFVRCDLADAARLRNALDKVHAARGAFAVVVNNAGLIHNEPLLTFQNGKLKCHDPALWNKVLSATLSAGFYVTALCAEKMAATARPGVIINISSVCAAGNAGQSAYSAAKAGVNAMTAALAKELGPLGIRVAAIAPGYLDTPSTRAHMDEASLARVRNSVPLRKLGRPEQLVSAVRFIRDNEYFNGKVLELDGGLTL